MSREDFELIASLITSIFPQEITSRFYLRANQGRPATGKLFHSYWNQRQELAKLNLITRNKKTKKVKGIIKFVYIFFYVNIFFKLWVFLYTVEPETAIAVFADDAIKFLESHVEPWDEIITKWHLSFDARQKIVASDISTSNLIKRFPCYEDKRCLELISYDTRKKYPQVKNFEESNWEVVKNCILTEGSKKLKRNRTLKSYFDSFKNSDYPGRVI